MAQNTFAKAIVKSAYITNFSGKQVDITKSVMTIDVYEDIYSPFVYCDMVIIDTERLSAVLPLVGEETFVLEFQSMGGRLIQYQFLLYKNDTSGSNATNSVKGYVLRGVTFERAFDSGRTVDTSYVGTYSSIAGQIFDDYLAKDTAGVGFDYEPSRSIGRYIGSQVTPLTAMEYCRQRAVSTSEARSPFVFFRNSYGYLFMSLNGLFNQMASAQSAQITHRYSARTPSAEFDEETEDSNVDIVDFDIVTHYDSMSKIDGGAFNSQTFSFDLTTKSFGLKHNFNYVDHGKTFQLGGTSDVNREQFTRPFANTRCVAYYLPTNTGLELTGDQYATQKNFYPEYVGEMAAYLTLVGEYNVHYTIYGDSSVAAGQVMKIAIPMSKDTSDKGIVHKNDPMYSGNFLCARVRHTLTFNENVEYYCRISAINGSRNSSIEEIST
jgi:hypothetical protein